MHCDMNGKSVGPAPVAASHRLRLLALPIRVEYGNAEAHADIYDSTPCSRREMTVTSNGRLQLHNP